MSPRVPALAALLVLLGIGQQSSPPPDGIELHRGALVLFGNANATSRPAWIVHDTVVHAAPETRTIEQEGVRPGSARHDLLVSRRLRRIRRAAALVARDQSFDCIVRKHDVKDARGLEIVDVTDAVVDRLPSVRPDRR